MDRHTFSVLELAAFLERLSGYATCGPGERWCRDLGPSSDIEDIEARLDLVFEAGRALAETGGPRLGGLVDVTPLLERIRVEGTFLPVEDLGPVADLARTAAEVRRSFQGRSRDWPALAEVTDRLGETPELVHEIETIIGPGQTVAEEASPALARLRRRRRSLRGALREGLATLVREPRLRGAVQDEVVVERGGRYVVPIKAEAASQVPGIVHDRSQTKATVFVEPLEVVAQNNELNDCRRAVVEEEIRLLRRVAESIRRQTPTLTRNLAVLGHLDGLMAVARFARAMGATRPEVALQGPIDLRAAVHPLLFWRQQAGGPPAQPIDLRMAADERGLILSGANAGGKTAALKTLGLVTLMVQCGLPVPAADGARVVVFREILAAGDEAQDLSGDRSTFSAHALRLGQVLAAAGERTLVLLDELGAGTDPGEAAALGMAVLDELLAQGARVVVTTHLHLLKAYAAGTPGVVNVSVGPDDATGRPTYALHYGLPGRSNALAVAAGLGLAPELIERAKGYLPTGEEATWRLIVTLEEKLRRLEQTQGEVEQTRAESRAERDRFRRAREKFAAARTRILDRERGRARAAVSQAQTDLKRLLREARSVPADQAAAAETRRELGRIERRAEDVLRPPAPPGPAGRGLSSGRIGEAVFVPRLGKAGTLLDDVTGQERVEVLIDRVKVNLPTAELRPAGDRAPAPRPARPRVIGRPATTTELNLIGRRVDEALPLVDRYLDQALLSGLSRVEIIHGVGTGALRRAIHEHLSASPGVKSFGSPTSRPGGMGVTVVDLE